MSDVSGRIAAQSTDIKIGPARFTKHSTSYQPLPATSRAPSGRAALLMLPLAGELVTVSAWWDMLTLDLLARAEPSAESSI